MQLLVQQLSPEPSNHGFGIETLQTGSYVLQAYKPETGVQFFATADLKTEHLSSFLVCPPAIQTPFILATDPYRFIPFADKVMSFFFPLLPSFL